MGTKAHADEELRYLDLDGDGVPDAVETTRITEIDVDGDGTPDIIEVSRERDVAIDDDGHPAAVERTETVAVDLEGRDELLVEVRSLET